ncbi:hypothetical protein [Streptomyces sp. RTd22]|uniref:hypothetical protein n=1 Tax=Streptomyces sp. RTd22 TaxID=1841249 RepID=UPI0007C481CD|nr:hypothetical protein [Streptomyces sp. RTd22]
MQQQVRGQAEAEHAHWLRQQRLAAYEGFMAAFDSFARTATSSLHACEARRARVDRSRPARRADLVQCVLSAAEVDAIGGQVRALVEQAARVSVVGPVSVGECAARLTTSAGVEHARYVSQRQRAVDESMSLDDLVQAVETLPGEGEASAQVEENRQFLAAVRQVLNSPPALDPTAQPDLGRGRCSVRTKRVGPEVRTADVRKVEVRTAAEVRKPHPPGGGGVGVRRPGCRSSDPGRGRR